MGLFMDSSKRVIVKNIAANNYVQIDNATTLSFYIVERNQDTDLASIDYQVEKISGRTSDVLDAWSSISMADVDNGIYNFDYTVAAVTINDKISFKFKVIDVDGQEFFLTINDIKIIA